MTYVTISPAAKLAISDLATQVRRLQTAASGSFTTAHGRDSACVVLGDIEALARAARKEMGT